MKTAKELIDEVVHNSITEASPSDLKRYLHAIKQSAGELAKAGTSAEICDKAVQVLWDLDSVLEQLKYDDEFSSSVGQAHVASKNIMDTAKLFQQFAKQVKATR